MGLFFYDVNPPNYKISEKKITQLLRREFKNSIFVAGAKHYEKMFDDFTNLNIVDDVLNAKEFLKEIYFSNSTFAPKPQQ